MAILNNEADNIRQQLTQYRLRYARIAVEYSQVQQKTQRVACQLAIPKYVSEINQSQKLEQQQHLLQNYGKLYHLFILLFDHDACFNLKNINIHILCNFMITKRELKCFCQIKFCLLATLASQQNQQHNYRHFITQMTAKVKTNILYIASDQSSSEDNPSNNKNEIEKKKSSEAQKTFSLSGSHRLSNNLLSKGLFMQQTVQNDYEYEKPKKKHNPEVIATQTNTEPTSLIRSSRNHKNSRSPKLNQSPKAEEATSQLLKTINAVPSDIKIKKQSSKRSKTLMFQFSQQQQQDDEIHQQKNIAQQIQKVVEKQVFQIHREKSSEEQSQSPKSVEEKKPITPNFVQQKIDMKQFMLAQVPRDSVLECRITKKNQLSNLLLSQFDMTFRNYVNYIASCKKFIGSVGANYRLSLDQEDFRNCSNKIIGKVRSYESKDLYNIYDDGVSPQNAKPNEKAREILATVRIRTQKGPRELEVYVLGHNSKYSELLGRGLKTEPNLETLYNIEQNRKSIHLLRSRKPVWVQQKREYYLNFRGRINQASIRNFILEDAETKEQALLFGKSSNNNYNIDISHPLTPRLGFCLVIPQLDRDD